MMRKLLSVLVISLIFAACGCDDDSTGIDDAIDAATFVALVDNDTLVYLQIDTVVTIDSTYTVVVTQDFFQVTVHEDDGQWIFRHDGDPALNILIGAEAAMLNAYWRQDDTTEIVTYFAEPPVLLHRELIVGDTWSGYTPSYTGANGSLRLPIYFANFGFHFVKTFVGPETVTITAGQFAAYRYDMELFINTDDSLPVANVTEYYARDIGLVRLVWRGGGLTRVLSLVRDS